MIDYKWNELRESIDTLFKNYGLPNLLANYENNSPDLGNDLIHIIRTHFEGE